MHENHVTGKNHKPIHYHIYIYIYKEAEIGTHFLHPTSSPPSTTSITRLNSTKSLTQIESIQVQMLETSFTVKYIA